ncbi:hypothetical protein [Brumimicrobium aurantiacum]|nr:hypothetical protein [Brumimicrobium aurantiacum]
MKKLIPAFAFIFSSFMLFAQNTYEDLLIIQADGDWEKLIKKADRYTTKSSTSKDPLPYYYMSYGLYKISFQAERDDEYKGAYKDAFTAMGKMLRYDESGEVEEKHTEFINELKFSLLEIIQNEVENEEYKRAFGWSMRLYKFGRDYIPALYMEGALRTRKNDATTGRNKWEEANKLMKDADVMSWSEADQKILMSALFQSAKVLKEMRLTAQAKEMMDKGAPYFEDLERWQEQYDEIINS